MEKLYLRDYKKMSILDAMVSIMSILKNTKRPVDIKKADVLRKIFIDSFSNCKHDNYPEFTLEVAKLYEKENIEIDFDALRKDLVEIGLITLNGMQRIPSIYLELKEKSDKVIENSFIYDKLYYYFEDNLKKIIISEIFKRFYNIIYFIGSPNLFFKVKISKERLENLFENENLKNKNSFFYQQLKLWTIYNKIFEFIELESKGEDLFIKFDILKGIMV